MISSEFFALFPILFMFFKALIIAIVGAALVYFVMRLIHNWARGRVTKHAAQIIEKTVLYFGLGFVGISVMRELGFQLSVLLGAAGVAGVALGFASQTSVSNIISGLFLLLEQSFVTGDRIQCGSIIGKVESIDLLSVKIRTANNTLVRIPNEAVLKQHVVNTTYFPIQRCVFDVLVTPESDFYQVEDALKEIIAKNKHSLTDPAPSIEMNKVTYMTLTIKVKVWVKKEDYFALQRGLLLELRDGLAVKNISAPIIRLA